MSLELVKARVEALAAKIAAPCELLRTYGHTRDGAYPHIEFADDLYHFVVVERGHELERISSAVMGEVLYHAFNAVTFSMAMKY